MLVVRGKCCDFAVVELLGEQTHHPGTVLAEAAFPHLQLECRVSRILSAEVWDRWQLADAARAMANRTGRNSLDRVARLGEQLTFLDEGRICARQRKEWSVEVRIVGGHVVDIVRRQHAGDR